MHNTLERKHLQISCSFKRCSLKHCYSVREEDLYILFNPHIIWHPFMMDHSKKPTCSRAIYNQIIYLIRKFQEHMKYLDTALNYE